MRQEMSHENPVPADLVKQFLPLIKQTLVHGRVLDLACGNGRNGLFLLAHNLPVVFADKDAAALEQVSQLAALHQAKAEFLELDLEAPGERPLDGHEFEVILVFNYLHRPLVPAIKKCLAPGGLLLYETFTEQQASIGRPRNPDFLLKPAELFSLFQNWGIIHSNEGYSADPRKFYANIVARKPGTA